MGCHTLPIKALFRASAFLSLIFAGLPESRRSPIGRQRWTRNWGWGSAVKRVNGIARGYAREDECPGWPRLVGCQTATHFSLAIAQLRSSIQLANGWVRRGRVQRWWGISRNRGRSRGRAARWLCRDIECTARYRLIVELSLPPPGPYPFPPPLFPGATSSFIRALIYLTGSVVSILSLPTRM